MTLVIKKRRSSCAGFTLVELVVAMAILGILSAIAIPNLRNSKWQEAIRADAHTAASIVRAVRIQFVETQQMPSSLDTIPEVYLSHPDKVKPSNGEEYTLDTSDVDCIRVRWTPKKGKVTSEQTYIEGVVFEITP